MTDGMLVRESAWESAEGQGCALFVHQSCDPSTILFVGGHHSGLRACSIVVLDEAHERMTREMQGDD